EAKVLGAPPLVEQRLQDAEALVDGVKERAVTLPGLLQGLEGAPTLGEIRDEAEDPAGPALLVLEARERQGDDQLGAIGEKQAALVGPRLPRVEDPHEQLLGPSGGAGRDDLVELPPQEELPRAAQRAT